MSACAIDIAVIISFSLAPEFLSAMANSLRILPIMLSLLTVPSSRPLSQDKVPRTGAS
jgi:hypothetical protein